MMPLRRALPVALAAAALMLAPPAPARTLPLDDVRFESWGRLPLSFLDAQPYYLRRAELLALPLPPPPANSAPSTRSELDELLRLQAARTRDQQRSIERHREYAGVCEAFLEAVHVRLDALPRTRALLDHVELDARLAVFHAKRRFQRPRPHQLEPRLRPAIHVPPHPAYPSGHALQGFVVGRVLGMISPENREAFAALGVQIGREREIAGLHYPSDSAASRSLGAALFALLVQSSRFQQELEAARAEWRR